MHSLSQTHLQQPDNYSEFVSKLKLYFGSLNISVRLRADYRHSQSNQPSILLNIWFTSPDSLPLQVGTVEHLGTSSIKDCLPKSKMKLFKLVNQIHYHNSDYWHNLSMDVIGNKKKKLGESEIHNLRKRNPTNR